jgi:hypothetical protein
MNTARSIKMRDDAGLRWMSLLPLYEGGTHYAGQVLDLLPHLDTIREALGRQVDEGVHRPGLIAEHVASGTALGQVVKTRILTQSQALALGIEGQQAPVEIYAGVDVRDAATAAAYDEGRLLFTSPDIRGAVVTGEPYVDETGHEWPFFVGELSVVARPHNKRQVSAAALRGVQMGDKRKVKMTDGSVMEIETEAALPDGAVEVDMEETAPTTDPLAALMAQMQALMAKVDALAATAPAAAAAAPMSMTPAIPAPAPPMAPVTMADMDRRIAERMKATDEVRAEMGRRNFGALTEDALVAVRMSDANQWRNIVAVAPVRPGAQSRTAGVGTSPEKQVETARVLMSDPAAILALKAEANGDPNKYTQLLAARVGGTIQMNVGGA